MSAPPRLAMRGVRRRFGAVRALDGVDLEVRAGEVLALLGENGAGKSTLLKVLAGAVAPDAGALALDGEPFAPRGPLDALRRGVATIHQEPTVAPHLTVAENVLLGREPARAGVVARRRGRAAVERALALLGHPELAPGRRVAELGPGERRLVEIARALVGEARVVVLDEPTASLAAPDVERLFAVIARLAARGVAVVHVSHFLEEVARIADRWVVLRDGRTVGAGAIDAATPFDAAAVVALMAGRRVDELYPRGPRTPGAVVLELDGLAGAPLPRAASLALRRGEVLGIAGLVGAGRTELLRAVFGLAPVRAGRVRVAARGSVGGGAPSCGGGGARAASEGGRVDRTERSRATPAARLAQGVGLLSEDRDGEGLAGALSIADNLTLSRLGSFGRAGFVSRSAQDAATRRWIERLGIRCRGPRQRVRELSGGNRQKVALARLLHTDVDVLLLDEPTRGVDVHSKAEIYQRIDELAAAGKAVLVVSSYTPELLGICDRLAVMHRGVLGPARPIDAWTETAVLDAATRGGAA